MNDMNHLNCRVNTGNTGNAGNAAAAGEREDLVMNTVIAETHAGVDTCVWLMEPEQRQQAFFRHLDEAQRRTGQVIWTNEEVIAEIRRKEKSPREGLANAARNALRQIRTMLDEHRLIVYEAAMAGADQRRFADAAFLSLLLKNMDVPVTLITLDGDLAADVMNLRGMRSVEGAVSSIAVYRVNGSGYLGRFDFITTSDGRYYNPKNSPLQVDATTPVAREDATLRKMPDVGEGDVFYSEAGSTYRLGEELCNGGEADIYAVDGCPDLIAKLFTSLSDRKEAKCRLLNRVERSFPCAGAVLPQDILFDVSGAFRGYVMKHIHGVELTRLLTSRGQKKYTPNWNRGQFVELAATVADTFRDLSALGMNIVDVSPGNILVGYNESGVLDPKKVFFIDLDSAQFGTREAGVYPADGMTSEYAPPECLRAGFTPEQLLTRRNLVFGASILCMQLAMCGVHPYRKTVEQGQTLSIARSIAAGAFPYSAGGNGRMATAPDGADKLWSNMPSEAKRFFYGLFQQGGQSNAIDKRPSFFMLSKVVHNHVDWLTKPETLRRYPEVLSLNPKTFKPFVARCAHPECRTPEVEFAVTAFRTDGKYYCEDCLKRIRNQRRALENPANPPVSVRWRREEPVAPLPQESARTDGTAVRRAVPGREERSGRGLGLRSVFDPIRIRRILNLN